MLPSDDGWIGVDLDGTLAFYDKWRGVEHIGDPIPTMATRMVDWLTLGQRVKIMTARICDGKESTREIIQDWTEKHFGVRLEVTNVKDFSMIELWDDRAVQVELNTGRRVDEIERRSHAS